jgi:uncharacterized oligopeptide transporter (OPT) family protein
MAIKQLTDEQIQTWTREQKDRWWLENVYRGSMPQLTLRSALMGFVLGSVLSATNLYVGAKTGWSLGVGITSVILAFAFFKVVSSAGARHFTILENNCVQSIATSAGYMTAPLISSLAAIMIVEGRLLPWYEIMAWNIVLSILGVLFAFPLKRRFINEEQHPFPEGKACGVVLDTLHESEGTEGVKKAKVLLGFGLGAAALKFIQAEAIQEWLQFKLLGREGELYGKYLAAKEALRKAAEAAATAPEEGKEAAKALVKAAKGAAGEAHERVAEAMYFLPENLAVLLAKVRVPELKIAGITSSSLTVSPVMDLALMGAGGLMGIRAAFSLMLGAALNYCVLVPWMAHRKDVPLTNVLNDRGEVIAQAIPGGFRTITLWSLWPGVACMVVASFVVFFAKPQIIVGALRGMLGRKAAGTDVLKHIEVPIWVSVVGVPVMSVVAALMGWAFFDVNPWLCLLGLPLAFILSMIAANSTALTGTTPVGATAKITQLFYGLVAPGNIKTNLATGSITGEVVSNSSNLLMDIKPGYMLGAKPRQQAIGHVIGIFAGALASTPLFFILFTQGVDKTTPEAVKGSIENLQSNQFPMPSVSVWKGVAEVLTQGVSQLPVSVVWAIAVASLVGIAFEVSRIVTKGRFPISPVAMGLAFVIHFHASLAFFAGALIFWLLGVGRGAGGAAHGATDAQPKGFWRENHEAICAGVIAGAALMGIGDAIVAAFVL